MEEYIEQTEKFLRGQMCQQEEVLFKASLATDERFRSFALIMAIVLKAHQNSQ